MAWTTTHEMGLKRDFKTKVCFSQSRPSLFWGDRMHSAPRRWGLLTLFYLGEHKLDELCRINLHQTTPRRSFNTSSKRALVLPSKRRTENSEQGRRRRRRREDDHIPHSAPPGCHLHRGSGVFTSVGHKYDKQGLSQKTKQSTLLPAGSVSRRHVSRLASETTRPGSVPIIWL